MRRKHFLILIYHSLYKIYRLINSIEIKTEFVKKIFIFETACYGASTLARNKNYYKPQKCGLFYVKFYLFLCCTELYFIFICDIMRYETQL